MSTIREACGGGPAHHVPLNSHFKVHDGRNANRGRKSSSSSCPQFSRTKRDMLAGGDLSPTGDLIFRPPPPLLKRIFFKAVVQTGSYLFPAINSLRGSVFKHILHPFSPEDHLIFSPCVLHRCSPSLWRLASALPRRPMKRRRRRRSSTRSTTSPSSTMR